MKEQKKGHPMSGENLWEKGMAARRAIANMTPRYSKVLKFKVLKPIAVAGERLTADDFDVELEQDSGGNDDTELLKLLRKVTNDSDFSVI